MDACLFKGLFWIVRLSGSTLMLRLQLGVLKYGRNFHSQICLNWVFTYGLAKLTLCLPVWSSSIWMDCGW